MPQRNLPHQMAAACDKQGSAGDGRSRPNKRGDKEEIELDWTCLEERSEQRLCCCTGMEAGGEEKQRQTQNNLASHREKGERPTRMEHMDKSKADSKQPLTLSGGKMSGPCAPPGTRRLN